MDYIDNQCGNTVLAVCNVEFVNKIQITVMGMTFVLQVFVQKCIHLLVSSAAHLPVTLELRQLCCSWWRWFIKHLGARLNTGSTIYCSRKKNNLPIHSQRNK